MCAKAGQGYQIQWATQIVCVKTSRAAAHSKLRSPDVTSTDASFIHCPRRGVQTRMELSRSHGIPHPPMVRIIQTQTKPGSKTDQSENSQFISCYFWTLGERRVSNGIQIHTVIIWILAETRETGRPIPYPARKLCPSWVHFKLIYGYHWLPIQ